MIVKQQTRSQKAPRWKGPIRTTRSSPQPHAAALQTPGLRAASQHLLSSGSSALCLLPLAAAPHPLQNLFLIPIPPQVSGKRCTDHKESSSPHRRDHDEVHHLTADPSLPWTKSFAAEKQSPSDVKQHELSLIQFI